MNLKTIYLIIFIILAASCKRPDYSDLASWDRQPLIHPDYNGVTIPVNIAPLNFVISEEGESFIVIAESSKGDEIRVKSRRKAIRFPVREWKKLLSQSSNDSILIRVISSGSNMKEFKPFFMHVKSEPVDPYLCYRILYPGYRSWVDLKIVQRSVESFEEHSVFENRLLDNNCVNCHSFRNNDPEQFMLHVRGNKGGTYIVEGNKITRTSPKTENMQSNVVYPSLHPMGRYIAFSSNRTVQSFHMRPEKNIEVYDLSSSMVIYDTELNETSAVTDNDTTRYMDTFPFWSPDGKYLYFCRTRQPARDADFSLVRYDLVRRSFDNKTGVTGNAEMVYNASVISKSVSFPVVSPDGKYLVFTLHDYGTFSIWHKEADLYLLDLQNGSVQKMALNSDDTESWHCWSSNNRWLVFSSKRLDGLTARPFFTYIDPSGASHKPFVLPQKDPYFYDTFEKTFNRPELVKGRIKAGPRDFEKASGTKPLQATWKK